MNTADSYSSSAPVGPISAPIVRRGVWVPHDPVGFLTHPEAAVRHPAHDDDRRLEPARPACALGFNAEQDDGLSAFLSVRRRLYGIAYRMLRSTTEAEDLVQDVWMRWQTTDRTAVRDAAAFLVTTTTRLAINVLQSARARRETYIGPWLPEPVDTSSDPGLGAERNEALQFAVMVLLEKLTPKERAAYILREAFDYTYRDIAQMLRLEEACARQLVTRARQHIGQGRRASVSADEQKRLLAAFISAAQRSDATALEGLFAADIVSTSDGGGFVRAARIPVAGRQRVAKFIAAVAEHSWAA